eukprot:g674.t1
MPSALTGRDVRGMECYLQKQGGEVRPFEISGLKSESAKHLNGQTCRVLGYDSTGDKRLAVDMCTLVQTPQGQGLAVNPNPDPKQMKKVKIENLIPHHPMKHIWVLLKQFDGYVLFGEFIESFQYKPNFDGHALIKMLQTPQWCRAGKDLVPFCDDCLRNYEFRHCQNQFNQYSAAQIMEKLRELCAMGKKPVFNLNPAHIDKESLNKILTFDFVGCAPVGKVMAEVERLCGEKDSGLCCYRRNDINAMSKLQEGLFDEFYILRGELKDKKVIDLFQAEGLRIWYDYLEEYIREDSGNSGLKLLYDDCLPAGDPHTAPLLAEGSKSTLGDKIVRLAKSLRIEDCVKWYDLSGVTSYEAPKVAKKIRAAKAAGTSTMDAQMNPLDYKPKTYGKGKYAPKGNYPPGVWMCGALFGYPFWSSINVAIVGCASGSRKLVSKMGCVDKKMQDASLAGYWRRGAQISPILEMGMQTVTSWGEKNGSAGISKAEQDAIDERDRIMTQKKLELQRQAATAKPKSGGSK